MFYKYEALSPTGHEIIKVEEGPLLVIKEKLKQKNYQLLSVEPDYLLSLKTIVSKKRIRSETLAVFFYDLLNSLKTGISIHEALMAEEEDSTDIVLKKVLNEIQEEVKRGLSLTESFQKTKAFPWLVLNMIKVGEKSGGLEQVFEDLSKYYTREAEFKVNLQSAFIYPAVVFCFLIGLMFYISFQVIPKLQDLIMATGKLHPATKAVMVMSSFLQHFWWLVIVVPLAIGFAFTRIQNSKIDKIAGIYYRIPLVGKLMKDVAFSTLFLNLAVLQKNGIGVIDSLALIAETTPYKFLAKKLINCKDDIERGFPFWAALEKDKFFSQGVCLRVKKGEETGRLSECLSKLAEMFFGQVTRETNVLLTFVQPVLLVICAGFLLIVCLSFIAPIYGNLGAIAGGNLH